MTEQHPQTYETIPGEVVDQAGKPVDEAVPEWNPLMRPAPVTVPLDAGDGTLTLTLQRWSGREQLAYEDAITERLLTTDGRDGTDTIKLGSLKLFAISLTIKGSTGFERFTGRPFLVGTREEIERDLLLINDADTYAEIASKALDVQPLPRAGGSKDDEDEATAGDPSPELSTPPTPVDAPLA